jgi:hypothetical protein
VSLQRRSCAIWSIRHTRARESEGLSPPAQRANDSPDAVEGEFDSRFSHHPHRRKELPLGKAAREAAIDRASASEHTPAAADD